MQNPDPSFTITVATTREQAFVFLKRLATDDEFRAQFEANPLSELAEIGVEISPPEAFAGRLKAPPKAAIERAIGEIAIGDAEGVFEPIAPFAPFAPFWPFAPFMVFLAIARESESDPGPAQS